jgi:acyl-CoA thioesterase I
MCYPVAAVRLRFVALLAFSPLLWGCTAKPDQSAPATGTTITGAGPAATGQPGTAKKIILFYGNSLSAGLGVEPDEAFPARVGEKIDSAGLNYEVVNGGLSGETTAGGLSRLNWVLRRPADVFVLELGGNDGLRGIPIRSSRQNLQAIIDTVRRRNPQTRIVLAGMQIPPNMGQSYTTQFREMFRELATRNRLTLIPFLLEGVGGNPKLNQPDGIHPTVAGHRIVANTVWSVLKPLLLADQKSGAGASAG